ncbi:hypothetical protein RQP53_22610 [Paucibacter sp. APW11]|uniref:Uncharacterized protein n=1 Tax=Roseateles aquae TaxID=3077235 RepID=A0ABU3PHT2_9BURK|nr:hypothetical protein [Paucibacter sp. APW11]MDT9002088.1 hypothetical protein [Paucibacter sp. APW11]
MLSLNLLPTGLPPSGPQGESGPCEMTLLNSERLQGRLQAFHDGDLALDLQLAGQRWPLCVPLKQLQWLRLSPADEANAGPDEPSKAVSAGVPVLLSGPASQPLRAVCTAARPVRDGAWLELRLSDGPPQRWFIHDLPRVQLLTLID